MTKGNDDKTVSITLAKDTTGSSEPSAGDLAKEIRARVADLNELVEMAVRRNVHVAYTVLEPEDFDDGDEHEELAVVISQRI